MTALTAVSGATGQLGGRVARRLSRAGVSQRLLVRDAARAPGLPGAEIAVAEYADTAAMRSALTGVDTFFFVSGSESADRQDQHARAVEAAVAAGVRRVVYVSFIGAAPDCTFTFARDHWHTEQVVRDAGVDFTFLRDNLYQDVLPYFVGDDGVLRGPAGDGRAGVVCRDDIADVAVAVLTGAGHDKQTYDVTGPRAITFDEVAEMLSAASGREVRYHAETIEEAYASRQRYGAPQWAVDGWVTSYAAVAAGELDAVTDVVERLAGHPATDFADYLGGRYG
jgi:NAD(P)H dehydrogenase (quinone)